MPRTDFAAWLSTVPDNVAGLDPIHVQALRAAFPLDDVTIARARTHELSRLAPKDAHARITLRVLVNRYRQRLARQRREARAAEDRAWREQRLAERERERA